MKEIILTKNQVALVDDADYDELNKFKWFADKNGKTFYAGRNSPTINGKRHTIHMHHEVIGKPPKGFETDHKNGRGTDNQRKNLRHVTHRQNQQNLKNIKKTSIYPGVGWHKARQKWRAYIVISYKNKHIGLFTSELEAFEAYKQAVEKLGEKVIAGTV